MNERQILEQLQNSISRKVVQLRNQIRNRLNIEFSNAGLDITSEMYSVLRCLWEQDGINQQTISEKSFKEKANLTKLLDNLQKREYVFREVDKIDKRNKRIFLTEQGKAIKKQVLALAEKHLLEIENAIDTEALIIAKEVLDQLILTYK